MEIVFDKVSNTVLHNLSFTLKKGSIIGVTGKERKALLQTIAYLLPVEGNATIGDISYHLENIYEIKEKISFIDQNWNNKFLCSTVEEHITLWIHHNKIPIKEPRKRVLSALKMVGLTEEYLKKELVTLSSSEQKLLQIAISLLSNPSILLLDEPFAILDTKAQKKLERLFVKLKERYNKTIIIASHDSNMLYRFTEYMIFLKNGTILRKAETTTIYQNVKFLKRYHYEIPDIVLFTNKAIEQKGAKLEYHKDIRDLIKDVYKHV